MTVTGTISVAEALIVLGTTYTVEATREQLQHGATVLGVAEAQEIIVEGIINQAQYETLLDTGSMVTAPGLDPSADMDGAPLSVDVDRFDILTGLAESGDVTVTLDGLDDDIVAVSVTVGDKDGSSVVAVVNATEDGFVVDDIDVSGLSDGDLNVSVTVTDLAGNTFSTDTSFVLDTTADADADPLTLPYRRPMASLVSSCRSRRGRHDRYPPDLAGANGNASVDLSVDPADLAGRLGVLGAPWAWPTSWASWTAELPDA